MVICPYFNLEIKRVFTIELLWYQVNPNYQALVGIIIITLLCQIFNWTLLFYLMVQLDICIDQ